MNKLIDTKVLTGKIVIETGLHIGASTKGVGIGEIDNPVIKDARTGYPYIPGSSLKGKIRSLLELKYGINSKNKERPCECGNCDVCKVFGTTAASSKAGITRVLFRDAFLSEESKKELHEKNILPTEEKTENMINRLGGYAESPRVTERVIPGLKFDFEIAIRVFEEDNDIAINLLREGLTRLQKDALGGSISRGYGKVSFENLRLDNQEFKLE
jgi:CRISPR-associated protein Csm3